VAGLKTGDYKDEDKKKQIPHPQKARVRDDCQQGWRTHKLDGCSLKEFN
jgi:hypothetical protein